MKEPISASRPGFAGYVLDDESSGRFLVDREIYQAVEKIPRRRWPRPV